MDSYLRGNRGAADFLFPLDTWIDCQRALATVDGIMRLAASQCHLLFLTDLDVRGGKWPARRLRKPQTLGFSEVQIVFNPNYFQDNEVSYQLNKHRARTLLGLRRTTEFQTVKMYSAADLGNVSLLVNDLNDIIGSL